MSNDQQHQPKPRTHLKANDAAIIVIQRIKNEVSVVSCICCKEEKQQQTTRELEGDCNDLAQILLPPI